MEHSALHALLLTGLIASLGGALAMGWLILPSARTLGADAARDALAHELGATVAQWVFRAALAAAFASGVDLFVQVAELAGETIFAGVDVATVARFATQTTVGQLALLRIALLVLTAVAVRFPGRRWPLVTLLAGGAVLVTSFVSHAAAQPEERTLALGLQIAHLLAAAGWIGILLHLFAVRGILLADTAPAPARRALLAEIVRRFSPVALASTLLLAVSGVVAACRFLGGPGALFTSAYGLTLLVKLGLLVPAIVAGWVNFRRIRPALLGAGTDLSPTLRLFGRMLELEVTAGVFVIAVAGILASVSPPGDGAALQLTPAQTRAVLTPDWPTSHVENWSEEEDAAGPTPDDLRYSEFTHNWSGVFVTLLGLGWLAQAQGGALGRWAAGVYPFFLVPFGCFIAALANPELWVLRQISPWQAITNPAILEHQLGAVLVFVLAWLSWRDRRSASARRPLGYALPAIMIAGSLLLLGHAHSAIAVADDLTNLINVQHCILGTFGLFAGVARWYVLRGLVPARIGNWAWPLGVVGLGLFMAFFYREIV